MAHAAPSICEDTRRLDEEIQVSDHARRIVLEMLPYGADHADVVAHDDWYYFPDKTPEHNQEMILLACTLLAEKKLPVEQRYALQQLQGELENRLRPIPRPAPDGSNAEDIQHQINHAWELVYHWHHVLLGSQTAKPVAEQELYRPALQDFGRSGKIQRLPHVLGNPKTAKVLFPDLYRHMEEKQQNRELRLTTFAKEEGGAVRDVMAYVLHEIEEIKTQDIADHDAPEKGSFTADHKLFLGFLIPMSALLGPYTILAVVSAMVADLKNGRHPFHSAHEFLVGMQAIPEINPDLPEEEQAQVRAVRLKVIGLLAVALPAMGLTMMKMSQHG